MSYADERRAIEGRLAANFSALPIRFENQAFDMPESGGFVALSIRSGTSRQASTGPNPLYRNEGRIMVEILMPEKTGTQDSRLYADTIAGLFRGSEFSAGASGLIRCRSPFMAPASSRAGWHVTTVEIPYRRDRFFA